MNDGLFLLASHDFQTSAQLQLVHPCFGWLHSTIIVGDKVLTNNNKHIHSTHIHIQIHMHIELLVAWKHTTIPVIFINKYIAKRWDKTS